VAKKSTSFWDNPFGGLFDFNRDGKESLTEIWLAQRIIEECTRKPPEEPSYSYSSYHRKRKPTYTPDHDDDYEDSEFDWDDTWRDECEDGSDVGVDPYDYDSAEEYEEALYEARLARLNASEVSIHITIPDVWEQVGIKRKDYPNKRMYDAACYLHDLQQGSAYISESSSQEFEIRKCEFILHADQLAAKYLTVFDGFLYAQAIKEHFDLPIAVPDEDDRVVTYYGDLMLEVAEEDPELAVRIWGWCIRIFGPYPEFMEDKRVLYNFVLGSMDKYPIEFKDSAARIIANAPVFCDGLLTKSPEFPFCCAPLIVRALELGLHEEAQLMLTSAFLNPAGKGLDYEELIDQILSGCSDGKNLEAMEAIKLHLLPIIRQMENKRVQRLLPKYEERINGYIEGVETYSEKYRYSRKYAWRVGCADGSAYDIDPLDYETEEEYNQAIYDEKYAWRLWGEYDAERYGLNPRDYETEEEFNEAVDAAFQRELQKKRGKI